MKALELWAPQRGKRLCRLEMSEGQIFHLEHQNSIYLALVRETYQVGAQEEIWQTGLESPSAGVFEYYGFDPPSAGRVQMRRAVGPLHLRSMSYEHHRLLTEGASIALGRLARSGEPLVLKLATPQPPRPDRDGEARP